MNKKILVPLKQNDLSEEMIPYIEKVARRGVNVVFLVPSDSVSHPRGRRRDLGVHGASSEPAGDAATGVDAGSTESCLCA